MKNEENKSSCSILPRSYPEAISLSENEARCKKLIFENFGNRENFLKEFNPDKQFTYAKDEKMCFCCNAPTIKEASVGYSPIVVESWIEIQLNDLISYLGIEPPPLPTLTQCAKIIAQEYWFFKTSEILLFFYKFKAGHYERFYKTFDPIILMKGLHDFKEYRRENTFSFDIQYKLEKCIKYLLPER